MENVAPLFPEMNYDEFVAHVDKAFLHPASSHLRYGQVYFNILHKVKPQLADEIRGSRLDPFHKENIKQETHDFVSEHWNEVAIAHNKP